MAAQTNRQQQKEAPLPVETAWFRAATGVEWHVAVHSDAFKQLVKSGAELLPDREG